MIKEARHLKGVLDKYAFASGQEISIAKSKVFFFNTSRDRENQILRILGFKKWKLPCRYLGLPLAKGVQHGNIWSTLPEKMKEIFSSRKDRWLSWASKLMMLKSVIAALPIYMLSCLPLAVGANKELNKKMKDFSWKGNSEQHKFQFVKWQKAYESKKANGAGVKNLLL